MNPVPPRPPPARRTRVPVSAVALSLAAFVLAGCDDLDEALDCIDGDRPAFSRTSLPSPVLNELYRAEVTVSIENTSDDDEFGYEFAIEGELPPGIDWRVEQLRTVVFEGTPIELGTWMPTLGVRIVDGGTGVFDAGADADGLCRTQRQATYSLVVVSP